MCLQDIDAAYLFQDMGDLDDDLSSLLVPDLDFSSIASIPAPSVPKLPQTGGLLTGPQQELMCLPRQLCLIDMPQLSSMPELPLQELFMSFCEVIIALSFEQCWCLCLLWNNRQKHAFCHSYFCKMVPSRSSRLHAHRALVMVVLDKHQRCMAAVMFSKTV